MRISIPYRVHSVATESAAVLMDYAGGKVEAQVPCAVVELVRTDDAHDQGHTFRLAPGSAEQVAAQVAAFQVDAPVTLTIDTGDAA